MNVLSTVTQTFFNSIIN